MTPEMLDPPRIMGIITTLAVIGFSGYMLYRHIRDWRALRAEMRWYDEEIAKIDAEIAAICARKKRLDE